MKEPACSNGRAVIHEAQMEVDLQKTHNTKHMQKREGGVSHTKHSQPLKTVFTK